MVLRGRIQLLDQWRQECPELTNIDWLTVLCALVRHIRWLFHVDANQMIGGCGKTSEEIATEVCEQFVLKKIPWTKQHLPDTESVIILLKIAVACAYLDQSCRRKNGKRVPRAEISLDAQPHLDVKAPEESPEDVLVRREEEELARRAFEKVLEKPDRHPKFPDLVKLYMDDANIKPRVAARLLDVSVAVIYQMRKRLERRLRLMVPHTELEGRSRYDRKEDRRRLRRTHV